MELVSCFLLVLAVIPMFYGASQGKLGLGLGWSLGSFVVPGIFVMLAVAGALGAAGSAQAGSRGGATAGAGLSLMMLCGSGLASLVVPAIGVHQIAQAVKRDQAMAQRRRRPARESGRLPRKRDARPRSSSQGKVPKAPRRRRKRF